MLQELNTFEMNEIKGGITLEEYCAQLSFLFHHNYDDVWNDAEKEAWGHAHGMYCLAL